MIPPAPCNPRRPESRALERRALRGELHRMRGEHGEDGGASHRRGADTTIRGWSSRDAGITTSNCRHARNTGRHASRSGPSVSICDRDSKSVLERRFGEATEQRTPMVVRTEQMIRPRIVVVLPSVGQFPLEARHGLVGPRPMAKQTREAVDRRASQRPILRCLYSDGYRHVSLEHSRERRSIIRRCRRYVRLMDPTPRVWCHGLEENV